VYQKLTTLGTTPTLNWASKEKGPTNAIPYLSFLYASLCLPSVKRWEKRFRLWSMELILYSGDQEEETVGLSGRAILTVADVLLIEISAERFNAS
jgi:hypothetical protein